MTSFIFAIIHFFDSTPAIAYRSLPSIQFRRCHFIQSDWLLMVRDELLKKIIEAQRSITKDNKSMTDKPFKSLYVFCEHNCLTEEVILMLSCAADWKRVYVHLI